MDLYVAAVLLKHPTLPEERLEAELELAENIADASSAILNRLQIDGWEVFRISISRIGEPPERKGKKTK